MKYFIIICLIIGILYLIFNYGGHMNKTEEEIREEMLDEIEQMKKYNNSHS